MNRHDARRISLSANMQQLIDQLYVMSSPIPQIDQLNWEVVQLWQQGRYEHAIGVATQVRLLTHHHLGEAHPDYAQSLHNLAGLYCAVGDYARAEPLCRQA